MKLSGLPVVVTAYNTFTSDCGTRDLGSGQLCDLPHYNTMDKAINFDLCIIPSTLFINMWSQGRGFMKMIVGAQTISYFS